MPSISAASDDVAFSIFTFWKDITATVGNNMRTIFCRIMLSCFMVCACMAAAETENAEISGTLSMPPVFENGTPVVLSLDGLKTTGLYSVDGYQCHILLHDCYSGKDLPEVTLPYSEAVDKGIVFDALPYGAYSGKISLSRDNASVYSQGFSFQHLMPHCQPDAAVMAYDYEYSPIGGVWGPYNPDLGNRYGASWIRFEVPNWKFHEKPDGSCDCSEGVQMILNFKEHNIRSIILQCLYHVPMHRNLNDIRDFSTGYGRYMRQFASDLKGITQYFELGNEDNGSTAAIYTEIGRQAAAGIRSVQPFAVLANSGTAYIDIPWLEIQRQRGLLQYLDALVVHPYTNNSTPSYGVAPELGGVFQRLQKLQPLIDKCGGMKSIWSTEFGWPNSDEAGEAVRAALYIREMLLLEMAGLEMAGTYTLGRDYDACLGAPGCALNAYSQFRSGREFIGGWQEGPVYVAVFARGNDSIAVVWSAQEGPFHHQVRGNACYDQFGNRLDDNYGSAGLAPVYYTGISLELLQKAAIAMVDEVSAGRLYSALQLLEALAEKLAKDGPRVSFGVFANLYAEYDGKFTEYLTLLPTHPNTVYARITSFQNLMPHRKQTHTFRLDSVPASLRQEWKLSAYFLLKDGRRFFVPLKMDFLFAIHTDSLAIDGNMDKWNSAYLLRLDEKEYTRGSYGNDWTPGDCSATTWLQWNEDFLYFGAKVTDQTFNQLNTDDTTWMGDSIQLIFAPSAETADFREINLALTPKGPQACAGASVPK